MRRYTLLGLLGLITLLPAGSRADGVMVPADPSWLKWRERAYINEPEQKAVVYYRKGQETLIISPSFAGPADEFAWIVPVPSRPKVEVLRGAIFHELALLVANRAGSSGSLGSSQTRGGNESEVTVLERKAVGAYDVSVLKATDSGALMRWLKTNRYHLPEAAEGPVKQYIRERWTFVACRVRVPRAASGLHTGTLAPLRLTFRAQRAVYPMRLSAANPEAFDVLVYVILPQEVPESASDALVASSYPRYAAYGMHHTMRRAILPSGQRAFPTLANLDNGRLSIFVERRRVPPASCTVDYAWGTPYLVKTSRRAPARASR